MTKNKVATTKVPLTKADQINILRFLMPQVGEDRQMAKAIARLRDRLEFEESLNVRQGPAGVVEPSLGERLPEEEFEFTISELELFDIGRQKLEEAESYPGSMYFITLDELLEEKLEELRGQTETNHVEAEAS